jgi:LacI family transcriptional regulator
MGSKPTIRDVAKRAGVSIATVSYVLNDNSDEAISEQAKHRVRDAVRALNYHRAAAAVNLATQRTRNIGIILYLGQSDVSNPFYSFVIQGIIR